MGEKKCAVIVNQHIAFEGPEFALLVDEKRKGKEINPIVK